MKNLKITDKFKDSLYPILTFLAIIIVWQVVVEIKDIPQQTDKDTTSKSAFKMPLLVKILIWVVGIAVLSFVGIIAFYAIKAKMKQPESE